MWCSWLCSTNKCTLWLPVRQGLGGKFEYETYREGNEYHIVFQGHEIKVRHHVYPASGLAAQCARADLYCTHKGAPCGCCTEPRGRTPDRRPATPIPSIHMHLTRSSWARCTAWWSSTCCATSRNSCLAHTLHPQSLNTHAPHQVILATLHSLVEQHALRED